jgi:hypothetical protein
MYWAVVDTSVVSEYLPWIVTDKDPNSWRVRFQDLHQGSIVASEAFGHIVVVVVHEDRFAEAKDMAFYQDALVAADNLAAVGTELGQAAVALVLDGIHLPCLRHLSCLGVGKDIHLVVVLEGGFVVSHR